VVLVERPEWREEDMFEGWVLWWWWFGDVGVGRYLAGDGGFGGVVVGAWSVGRYCGDGVCGSVVMRKDIMERSPVKNMYSAKSQQSVPIATIVI
jgi:hypothetical protein